MVHTLPPKDVRRLGQLEAPKTLVSGLRRKRGAHAGSNGPVASGEPSYKWRGAPHRD